IAGGILRHITVMVVAMVAAYLMGPGRPGAYELIVQLILVAFAGLVPGILGFAIGWGIELVRNKKST
ncbi:unnamed protein product, partial [marine sediment metagenome]